MEMRTPSRIMRNDATVNEMKWFDFLIIIFLMPIWSLSLSLSGVPSFDLAHSLFSAAETIIILRRLPIYDNIADIW